MNPESRDERFMRRALDLAVQGLGRVEPNPMVGAVVVRGERIVGEGYHARFGGPHAEVVALEQAGEAARGAELFVSLEPCCHHGKTPPCTDAIVAAGVRRVVAAVRDPFPQVAGRGLAILQEAGLEVKADVLATDARRAGAAYFKRQATGLPLVIAKWAMSLDGCLTAPSAESRWISCEASRRRIHELRRVSDAVLVGAATARLDQPSLTVRHVEPIPERGQPTRVVLDGRLTLEADREPVRSARDVPVIIYTTEAALRSAPERADLLRRAGAELVAVSQSAAGVAPEAVLRDMGKRGMSRVLVEGGAKVLRSFFSAGLVDRVMVFISPQVIGAAGRPEEADSGALAKPLSLADLAVARSGTDILIEGRAGEF